MTALFSGRFEVVELGAITTSGVLTAHDFGWVRFDVAPFHLQVPAGSYPVELARDRRRHQCRGARALLRRGGHRHAGPSADESGSGNVVGVDAGNVAILDFGALTSCA